VWTVGFDRGTRERYAAYGRGLFLSMLNRRAATPVA